MKDPWTASRWKSGEQRQVHSQNGGEDDAARQPVTFRGQHHNKRLRGDLCQQYLVQFLSAAKETLVYFVDLFILLSGFYFFYWFYMYEPSSGK